MIRTARTCDRACTCGSCHCVLGTSSRERRQRPLDLAYNAERYFERLAPIFTSDDDRLLATNAGDEALDLESQWLTFRSLERHTLDKRFECQRRLCEGGEIDVAA